MIAVTHYETEASDFAERAQAALGALAARPGYLRGTVARSTDDPSAWLVLTEWSNVGSYRRALGNYQVKLHANPLLGEARDLPTGFEGLVDVAPGGVVALHDSDRTADGEPHR
jgi:hypothetical protein